tara:strand:+ start:134 stop:1018 length:885 start_codon:yes stop_codon:yes gene_type:complete
MTQNPDKMPYSIEDIRACKDIKFDKVEKDYSNLIKFKANTNPRKFCGNPTLYYYQYRNLLKCKRHKGSTIEEVFSIDETKQKLWKDTIKRNRRDKDPNCSATDVYECHRINTGAIVFFKASTAKFIYKKFNAKSVLDPTAGWGGRLLGASSLNIKYTGFDTNINLKDGYDRMIKDLDIKNCRMIYTDILKADLSEVKYDLVLTSPPYINMELYEHMTPFINDVIFYNEFLIPMLDKCYKHLQIGGHMAINISPKMFKSLMKLGYRKPDEEIDLRQQLGKQYKTKSQDYIYIWNK